MSNLFSFCKFFIKQENLITSLGTSGATIAKSIGHLYLLYPIWSLFGPWMHQSQIPNIAAYIFFPPMFCLFTSFLPDGCPIKTLKGVALSSIKHVRLAHLTIWNLDGGGGWTMSGLQYNTCTMSLCLCNSLLHPSDITS